MSAPACRGSDGEGAAAAAGLGGVGVSEIETPADEGRGEIQLHTVDVKQAFGIAHHAKLTALGRFVGVTLIIVANAGGIDEVHGVTHAAAAAGAHPHPQELALALLTHQSAQLAHRRLGDQNSFAINACVVGGRRLAQADLTAGGLTAGGNAHECCSCVAEVIHSMDSRQGRVASVAFLPWWLLPWAVVRRRLRSPPA